MKRLGAELILTTIFIPVFAWMISAIISTQNLLASLQTKTELREEMLKEIKEDVKFIKHELMENHKGE